MTDALLERVASAMVDAHRRSSELGLEGSIAVMARAALREVEQAQGEGCEDAEAYRGALERIAELEQESERLTKTLERYRNQRKLDEERVTDLEAGVRDLFGAHDAAPEWEQCLRPLAVKEAMARLRALLEQP